MAITRYVEVGSGQSADSDSKYVRTYVRTFLVESNSKSDGVVAVRSNPNTPALWSAHPEDAQALCQNVSVRQSDSTAIGAFFEVTAKYSTKYDQEQQSNPLDEPVKQSMSFTHTQVAIDRDTSGTPITNSAGDPPSDPVMITESYPVLRFVRNEATIPVAMAIQYIDKVNSDTFYGAAPGTMRVTNISSSDLQTKNDVSYYAVTYEIEYRPKTWAVRFVNTGYNSYSALGKKIKVAGSEPRLLRREPDDSTTVDQQFGHTVFTDGPAKMCRRDVYQSIAFSGLGL